MNPDEMISTGNDDNHKKLDYVLPEGWTKEEADAVLIAFSHGTDCHPEGETAFTVENFAKVLEQIDAGLAEESNANSAEPVTRETVVGQCRDHTVLLMLDAEGELIAANSMDIIVANLMDSLGLDENVIDAEAVAS